MKLWLGLCCPLFLFTKSKIKREKDVKELKQKFQVIQVSLH